MIEMKSQKIRIIGELNWIELRTLIVKTLNNAISHDDLIERIKWLVGSIGTKETIINARQKLGLAPVTEKEWKDAEND